MYDPSITSRSGALDGPSAAAAPAVPARVHVHDHAHTHAHDHDHGVAQVRAYPVAEVAHEPHRHGVVTPAPAFSLIGVSLAGRLGIAAALSVVIWAAVAWALAPIVG
jgi:hypothetical protein